MSNLQRTIDLLGKFLLHFIMQTDQKESREIDVPKNMPGVGIALTLHTAN